jgi:hypothetical protein
VSNRLDHIRDFAVDSEQKTMEISVNSSRVLKKVAHIRKDFDTFHQMIDDGTKECAELDAFVKINKVESAKEDDIHELLMNQVNDETAEQARDRLSLTCGVSVTKAILTRIASLRKGDEVEAAAAAQKLAAIEASGQSPGEKLASLRKLSAELLQIETSETA